MHLTGSCKALYCLSIGRSIDLERARQFLTSSETTTFHHKSRVPDIQGMAPPLRLNWDAQVVEVDGHSTRPTVEIALYDLGAVCITWEIAFAAPVEDLVQLSAALYGHADLTARSRALAHEVVAALAGAVERPRVAEHVEDYFVFETEVVEGGPAALLEGSPEALARILRAESSALSAQEVQGALAHPVSYGVHDVCLVDWLAAFLMGASMSDERFVLELATIELLELRLLDFHLEEQIEEAYRLLTRPRGALGALTVQRRELEHLARIQADDALLHEGIDNALKLFGDDYLARLYQTSGERFHFEDWDRSIQRKLGVLRSVYQSLADLASHRRSELLEWIIILLIAVDIALYFTPLR